MKGLGQSRGRISGQSSRRKTGSVERQSVDSVNGGGGESTFMQIYNAYVATAEVAPSFLRKTMTLFNAPSQRARDSSSGAQSR